MTIVQQKLAGTISKVDEANGKIAIQQTQSGTVLNPLLLSGNLKLVFNAMQPGDRVVFSVTKVGDIKTITILEKQ
jgi:hypothetical protein